MSYFVFMVYIFLYTYIIIYPFFYFLIVFEVLKILKINIFSVRID